MNKSGREETGFFGKIYLKMEEKEKEKWLGRNGHG
jgi:hypothetical protein